jgi:K+-transporting ATPase ATPase C chain
MASASGIDPEISLKAALFQVPRVAAVRGVSEDELRALVVHEEENCLFGLFPHRVNVLKLNCALDHHYPLSLER